nr:MAG TPA: hypothetical protein [Caudoviricetes sp.]DAU04007.1 MAG TPA: hypothetical protein [Caudoviricetes sp.]
MKFCSLVILNILYEGLLSSSNVSMFHIIHICRICINNIYTN